MTIRFAPGDYRVRITSDARPILEEALETYAVGGYGVSADELIRRISLKLRSRVNAGRAPADMTCGDVHRWFGRICYVTLFATQIAFCVDQNMKVIYLVGGGSDP